jgi:hypothetical protein
MRLNLGLAAVEKQLLTLHSLRPPQMRKTAPLDLTSHARY